MNHSEQRMRLRDVFAGNQCLSPASVYDPRRRGSPNPSATRSACWPDRWRRTQRSPPRPDRADADRVRRPGPAHQCASQAVPDRGRGPRIRQRSQRHAHGGGAGARGVSALSIEDTALPTPLASGGAGTLISTEGSGRKTPGRGGRPPGSFASSSPGAPRPQGRGTNSAIARARAYAACGVDAIFVVGLAGSTRSRRSAAAIKLPIIVGSAPAVAEARGPCRAPERASCAEAISRCRRW